MGSSLAVTMVGAAALPGLCETPLGEAEWGPGGRQDDRGVDRGLWVRGQAGRGKTATENHAHCMGQRGEAWGPWLPAGRDHSPAWCPSSLSSWVDTCPISVPVVTARSQMAHSLKNRQSWSLSMGPDCCPLQPSLRSQSSAKDTAGPVDPVLGAVDPRVSQHHPQEQSREIPERSWMTREFHLETGGSLGTAL